MERMPLERLGKDYFGNLDQRLEHTADRFATRLAIAHLHMTSHNGAYRHAFDLPTMPWGRLVFAMQLVYVDGAFFIHIDDGDIAVGAKPDCAFLRVDLPNLSRIFASHFDILIERQ